MLPYLSLSVLLNCNLHMVDGLNGRSGETCTLTINPYERCVLLFELQSNKMVGEEGVAPPTPVKVVFYRHVCPTDIHISPIMEEVAGLELAQQFLAYW